MKFPGRNVEAGKKHLRLKVGVALLISFFLSQVLVAHAGVPSLYIEATGSNVLLHYVGTLLTATNSAGPYHRLAGAISPYAASINESQRFWTLLMPGLSTVAAGWSHNVALRLDGTLWTWGDNSAGQLGNDTTAIAPSPQPIHSNVTWKTVAAGYRHSAAITEDGKLWTWGANSNGQLGNGNATNSSSPQLIQPDILWKTVATGYQFTLAVRADGTLWAWGYGAYGQLGIGTPLPPAIVSTPQPVLPETRWSAIAAGLLHSVGIQSDGSLWAWGDNSVGQLGLGEMSFTGTPLLVQTNSRWSAIAAGADHTVALREDGTLWAWGGNRFGELGNGKAGPFKTPQLVQSNVTFKALAAGYHHTIALREDGTLWGWGDNSYSQLGIITSGFSTNSPQPIATNTIWIAVTAGEHHTVALRSDETLWSCGDNYEGQLGVGFRSLRTNVLQQVLGGSVW